MALDMERINEIEQKAKSILDGYNIDTIPVNPLLITEKEDIDVYEADLVEGISGIIRKQEKGVSIYLKEKEYKQRQRFTLAHELGHYYLHFQDGYGNFVDSRTTLNRVQVSGQDHSDEELEANQFAAALLMPKESVIECHNEGYSLEKMATLFDVSRPAMERRIGFLKSSGAIIG